MRYLFHGITLFLFISAGTNTLTARAAGQPTAHTTSGMYNYMMMSSMLRLRDGAVLYIGGKMFDGNTEPADVMVQKYDPAQNKWTVVAPLHEPRYGHRSVLLPDGRVLVTGGLGADSRPLLTAEIYDPISNVWAVSKGVLFPHTGHDSILLKDGKVLVTGGNYDDQSCFLDTEVFDPLTGAWEAQAKMNLCSLQSGSEAYLLPSGHVIVIHETDYFKSEVFDPKTKTWSALPQFSGFEGVSGQTINGDVFISVGSSMPDVNYNGANNNKIFKFDEATLGWTFLTKVPRGRSASVGNHALGLSDGRILFYGDYDNWFNGDVYDPASKRWAELDDMQSGTNVYDDLYPVLLDSRRLMIIVPQFGGLSEIIPIP